MSIYCSLEEAYGDVFESKQPPKPPLSVKLNKKVNNSFSDFQPEF